MTYRTNTNWTEARCRSEILEQFDRWNRDEWDVIGAHDFPAPATIGSAEATVRFELRGVNIVVQCASQSTYRQNLRCIAFAVESMRMNEKRGIADTMRHAYLQLEAPQALRDPYEVMGIRPDATPTVIEATYKALAKELHPDAGGDADGMKELNEAYERVKAERGLA